MSKNEKTTEEKVFELAENILETVDYDVYKEDLIQWSIIPEIAGMITEFLERKGGL